MFRARPKSSPRSRDQSELVLGLLDSGCEAVTTTVIQLFLTDVSQSVTRRKHECGVLCLVKDSQRHSCFFQVYCIFRKQKVWEHKVDNNLEYLSPKSFLLTFDAGDAIVIFKFSSEDEACQMRTVVIEMLERERRGQPHIQSHEVANVHQHLNSKVSSKVPTTDSHLYNDTVPAVTQNSHSSVSSSGLKEKRKLTKADIGLPQNFRHVSHVGWDPNKGFDVDNVEDPQLKQFFDKAGVSDSQLQDRETREFIYDFINRHGGLVGKNELVLPSTSRVQHSTSPTSPPPPPPVPAPRTRSFRLGSAPSPSPPSPALLWSYHPPPSP